MVGAVVVTYLPDMDLLIKNINALVSQEIGKVVIVNNSPNKYIQLKHAFAVYDSVHVLNEKSNVGIAKALNDGLIFLKKNGYEYAMTMDQDSILEPKSVAKLYEFMGPNTCICGCRPVDRNVTLKRDSSPNGDIVEHVKIIITSGNLVNINIWDRIGRFNEALFIDAVDHEFCLRARKKGYDVLMHMGIELDHAIGEYTKKKFLTKTVQTSNHSAFRLYYMFRNNVYLIRKWWYREPKLMMYIFYRSLIVKIVKIILLEKNKFKKLQAVVKGTFRGIFFRAKW